MTITILCLALTLPLSAQTKRRRAGFGHYVAIGAGGSTTNFGQLNNTAISDSQPFTWRFASHYHGLSGNRCFVDGSAFLRRRDRL